MIVRRSVVMMLGWWWWLWCLGGVALQCVQEGPCKCTSDQGTIDLSPIKGSSNQAAFPDSPDPSLSWVYSYSPCTPFTEGSQDCINVAVCQLTSDLTQSYAAGTVDSAMFGTDGNGNTQITYTQPSSDIPRTTYVKLQCDQSGGPDQLSVQGERSGSPGNYDLTLISAHCCPSSGPGPGPSVTVSLELSVGSILCIALVGVAVVYVVAGVAVQKGLRKATGKEIIPNYSFWAALPGYVKDGVMFTFRGCKGSRTYDKI